MHHNLPLLVTGIAGVAGYNAFLALRNRFPGQVFGQRPVRNWPLRGEGILACDLEDTGSLEQLFQKHHFATVLNCGGSCALKSCELDPAMAARVNVRSIDSLLKVLDSRRQVRFVHLSIDLVFSGMKGSEYFERDRPDPVTVYGKTMVQAESLIFKHRPDACVLRISLPMGISFNGHAGAIDWIQSRFAASRPATLYYDEVRTPTYVECLIETIEAVMNSDLTGLYHAGGPRKLSLFEIAQIVNRIGGYNPDDLHGCYRIQAGPIPPRAGNVTMNSDKLANALGFDPSVRWPMLNDHVPIDRKWHYCRDSNVTGSPELLAQVLYQRPQSIENSPIIGD